MFNSAALLVAPLRKYDPSSVVRGPWAPVGCPWCSQLANRAASPQETKFTGRFSQSADVDPGASTVPPLKS
jgi:hypothetical protein